MNIYHQLLLNDARSRKDSMTCNADPEVLEKVNGIYEKLGEIGGLCPANGAPSTSDTIVLEKITEISRKLEEMGVGSTNPDTTLLNKIEELSRSLDGLGNNNNISDIGIKLEDILGKMSTSGSNSEVLNRINESSSNIITALSSKDGDRFMESMTKDREQFENLRVIMDDSSKIHVMTAEEVNRVDKDPKTMSLFKSINQGNQGNHSREFSNKIKAHFYFLMLTSTPFQNKTLLNKVATNGNITETFFNKIYDGISDAETNKKFMRQGLITLGKKIGKIDENSEKGYIDMSNEFVFKYPLLIFTYLFQYKPDGGNIVPKNKP